MNVLPEALGVQFVKRALASIVVIAVLIAGSAFLVDLGTTDRVTVTFEDDRREHVSTHDFKHQTEDARSGQMVIKNSLNGSSWPNHSLKILFRGTKEQVSIFVMTPTPNRAEVAVYGLGRGQKRVTKPIWTGTKSREWRAVNLGSGQYHGIEIVARDTNGKPVPVWADDLSFRESSPAISRAALFSGLAALWTVGIVTLVVTTGLFRRLEAIFGDGERS